MEKIELALEKVKNGVVLPVKAKPAARKNAITGSFAGALRVAVTAAPEKGKANKAIIKILSRELALAAKNISLISGELSSDKKFLICSLTAEEILAKIAELKI